MSNQNDGKRFGVWAMICTCAAVATAAAGGSWQVARARISDELAQYEKSKEWQLPTMLHSLGDLSAKLNADLLDRSELETLRKRDAVASEKLSELSAHVTSLEEENRKLSEELAKTRIPTIVIPTGEAKPVGSRGILVGVSSTNHYLNEAELQVGDKGYRLKVGGSFEASKGNETLEITLIRVVPDGATVTFQVK